MGFSDEVKRLVLQRPIPVGDVVNAIEDAARRGQPDDLDAIVSLTQLTGMMDEYLSIPALLVLPAWHEPGLQELLNIAIDGFLSSYALSILLSLAINEQPDAGDKWFVPENFDFQCYKLNENHVSFSRSAIRELVARQATDDVFRSHLFSSLTLRMHRHTSPREMQKQAFFFSCFTDNRLQINTETISQFVSLLDNAKYEEQIQKFLFDHPVFIDPMAVEIRGKHELGDDFITDFVLKRCDNSYVLVEIEKTSDRLFTNNGRVHNNLSDASGQVRDFQAWIHDNIAYAQRKLPGIRRPEGLVIIGRDSQLDSTMKARLDEENFSRRGHIQIVTFDHLVSQAKTVYHNMVSMPLRYKAKKIV